MFSVPVESEMWLRPREVASLLCVSRRTVYRLIAAGRLPVARLNPKSIRVPLSGLRNLMTPTAEGRT